VTRTSGHPPATVAGLSPGYVLAGALSVTVTMFVLQLARRPHPPAGATTLVVSLGVMTTPTQLLSLLGAVLLVPGLAVVATRRERSVAGSVS
jgi:CBS-domain-containing membrane protein